MSRIGKLPIKIPTDVDISNLNESRAIKVKGPLGTLELTIPEVINLEQGDGYLILRLKEETRVNRSLHGLHRTLIN